MDTRKNILEIKNMHTYFFTDNGVVKSVDGVDIELKEGSTLGIVGESGSGKSVTALSVMGLLMGTTGKVVEGEILLEGQDITKLSDEERRKIRGNKISMIFQEPMTSLNPVYRIKDQIVESILTHTKMTKKEAEDHAVEMLRLVGIPDPERRAEDYPHQMSGGMRQRVMIAMALACNPELLIADEPTTALDVTIQAQILELINSIREKLNMSVLLITHDLGVVAETADKVVVMYCGRVVEKGTVEEIFTDPRHPYTKGLLESIPRMDKDVKPLYMIKGIVPDPTNLPKGCPFADRCDRCMDKCREAMPKLVENEKGRAVRCFLENDAGEEE